MLMFRLWLMDTVGLFWLNVMPVVDEVPPMVTLMMPQELRLVVQTVIEDVPVVPVVLRVMVLPEMLVVMRLGLWLELFNTV